MEERRIDEAAGIEDVEAGRRALAQARDADAPEDQSTTELTFYGSARVHAIYSSTSKPMSSNPG